MTRAPRIEVIGLKELNHKLDVFAPAILRAVKQAILLVALRVATRIKARIHACESTGNPRPSEGRDGPSFASLPGFPPNSDSGQLARSWHADYHESSSTEVTAAAFIQEATDEDGMSVADYAWWLEEGTERVAPRPVIGPTVEEHKSMLEDLVREKALAAIAEVGRG